MINVIFNVVRELKSIALCRISAAARWPWWPLSGYPWCSWGDLPCACNLLCRYFLSYTFMYGNKQNICTCDIIGIKYWFNLFNCIVENIICIYYSYFLKLNTFILNSDAMFTDIKYFFWVLHSCWSERKHVESQLNE